MLLWVLVIVLICHCAPTMREKAMPDLAGSWGAQVWFARQYKVYRPNTLLLDNALATMGAGLPSAMAAKLVHPDRAVLAVVGDGGFMMNSQVRGGCICQIRLCSHTRPAAICRRRAGEEGPVVRA